jgi:predicted permease
LGAGHHAPMLSVFLSLIVIAALGASLHRFFDVDSIRRQCSILVLNVLLPALNVEVIYKSAIDRELWQVPVVMFVGAVVCAAAAIAVFSAFRISRPLRNALILGCAFGNVTYLGLPLLRGLFPEHVMQVTRIAILCEITVTSTDLVTGNLLAMFSGAGAHASFRSVLVQIVKFPLIWSTAAAVLIRMMGIPLPQFVLNALHLLGESAPGLMLLVLGMAIKGSALRKSAAELPKWWPLLILKLGLSPLIVGFLGTWMGLATLTLHSTTIEASVPLQLFTLIVADRFGFDTEGLAAAIAFALIVSMATLPIVKLLLSGY